MSGLPSFFQQRGKTVLDELADYELGGDLDEEDLEEEEIGDDTAFDDNFIGSDTELPSFFQSSTTEKVGPPSVPENDYPVRSEDVNLSQLLKNFTWPVKGTPYGSILCSAADLNFSSVQHSELVSCQRIIRLSRNRNYKPFSS